MDRTTSDSDNPPTLVTLYLNSRVKTIVNETEMEESVGEASSELAAHSGIQKLRGSGWVLMSIDVQYLSVVMYNPLQDLSYVELPKELQHPKKGLINLQNRDNECFRWCHVRCLHPQKTNPDRIKKIDKEFVKELNYDGVRFPVETKDYTRVETE